MVVRGIGVAEDSPAPYGRGSPSSSEACIFEVIGLYPDQNSAKTTQSEPSQVPERVILDLGRRKLPRQGTQNDQLENTYSHSTPFPQSRLLLLPQLQLLPKTRPSTTRSINQHLNING